jgi:hypothetical protein
VRQVLKRNLKFFTLMWDVLKDFEAFYINFQRDGRFFYKCWAVVKIRRL